MSWQISGQMIEACSCKMLCPCYFGPAEPDQGWCSGTLTMDIQRGSSDGVDLGGTRAVWAIDLPGDFAGGNGTGRIYLDAAASAEQRRELEAIFTGKKGGLWEVVAAGVISKWLSAQTATIEVKMGDSPSVKVGSVGQIKMERVKSEGGKQAKVQDPPAMELFGVASADLARGDGSWSDPDMRRWQAGGSGSVSSFNWST